MLGNRNQTKHVHDARAVDNNYRVPENSRGRYLIIVAEDTDLGDMLQQTVVQAPMNNFGENDYGGARTEDILKRFSSGFLLGGYASHFHSNLHNIFNFWPYHVKTNEDLEEGVDYANYFVNPPNSAYQVEHNKYEEPLLDFNFMRYLKSRGFVVDVAIMDRKITTIGGGQSSDGFLYGGAHPDDVPDYSEVIPYVTEDWTGLRINYGEEGSYTGTDSDYDSPWMFRGHGQYGDRDAYWKPTCLWAHIHWFRNRYKNTDHPLKYVLFLGEPCSMAVSTEGNTRPSQCIPGFAIPSYTYSMPNVADWPYHWSSELVKRRYDSYQNSNWYSEELSESLNLETYDDVLHVCHDNSIPIPDNFTDASSFWLQWLYHEDEDDLDAFSEYKSIIEPDISVSRIITKGKSDYNRFKEITTQISSTIGYHNFSYLYLLNSPFCYSEEGGNPAYGVCKKPEALNARTSGFMGESGNLPHEWGLFQDESFPEYNCRITGEDSIMAGCLDGECMWFSEDCSDWSEMEFFKEYLGNSAHIGAGYQDQS